MKGIKTKMSYGTAMNIRNVPMSANKPIIPTLAGKSIIPAFVGKNVPSVFVVDTSGSMS